MSLKRDYYNDVFSHIYVERRIREHHRTKEILKKLPNAVIIEIEHYKDIFCRKKQSVSTQNNAKALILAQNENGGIYEGAPVCQSFGNKNFYYCSCIMNCLFDCEYCYLKGMYPSGNMVVFVNIEDTFEKLRHLLVDKSIYLCISYDADLIACEWLCGFVREWMAFAQTQKKLTIEIRTKSGRSDIWSEYKSCDNVIIAYTLSPDAVANRYEHYAASLSQRIEAACEASRDGYRVRLCFDPMIYCQSWENEYRQMVEKVFEKIAANELIDVSVGSFRISQDYLKKMRHDMPDSAIVNFPYENIDGYYQYPENIRQNMENFMVGLLEKYIDKGKIFTWK